MPTKQDEWKAKNTTLFSIRIQNSSGVMDALEKAMADTGKTRHGYIVDAIREKLIRDGYMQEK